MRQNELQCAKKSAHKMINGISIQYQQNNLTLASQKALTSTISLPSVTILFSVFFSRFIFFLLLLFSSFY